MIVHGLAILDALAGPDMGLLQSTWCLHGITDPCTGVRVTQLLASACGYMDGIWYMDVWPLHMDMVYDTLEYWNKPNKGLGQA